MSKACALVVAILIVVLAVITMGSAVPDGAKSVSANEPGSTTTPGAVMLRSEVAPGEAVWMRLRWLFAGAAVSGVLLIARRQFLVFVRYREHPGGHAIAEPRQSVHHDPADRASRHTAIVADHDWFQSPAVSTAGER